MMRRLTWLSLVALFFCGCSRSSKSVAPSPAPPTPTSPFGAFQQTDGPAADSVYAMDAVPAPGILVAATSRGIQRTSLASPAWTTVDPRVARALIAVDAHVWYAGTAQGVLRSEDGGLTWAEFNAGLGAGADVRALFWQSTVGLFAGLAGSGIALFANGTDHWVDASTGLPAGATVTAIERAVVPAGVYLAIVNGTIEHSSDGTSWSLATGLPAGNPVTSLAPGYALAGTDGAALYSSTDGASWTTGSSGFPAGERVNGIAPTGFGFLAVTDKGMHTTGDGLHWDAVTTNVVPAGTEFTAGVGVFGSLFVGTSGRGVLKSDDGAATWRSFGPSDAKVVGLFGSATGVLAATQVGGLSFTQNQGVTWLATSLAIDTWPLLAHSAARYLAAGDHGLLVSINGTTWSTAEAGLPASPNVTALAADATSAVAAVAGSPAGIYVSSNDGGLWTPSAGVPAGVTVSALAASGAVLLAGLAAPGAQASVFASADHGATWASSGAGLPANTTVNALAGDGTIALAATGAGVFRSVNNGATWSATGVGAPHVATSVALHGGNASAVIDGHVWRSIDGGATWTQDPDVTSPANAVSAGLDEYLVGTTQGMWRAPY